MDNTNNDAIASINVDIDTQEILLAASQHNIRRLRELIRSNKTEENPVNVRDPETGYTPLHSAIAASEPDEADTENEPAANGDGESANQHAKEIKKSALESGNDTVKFLLQEGAIWNDLNTDDETPGCLARKLGLEELYQLMVDAGVRAELLLNRLDGYEPLIDEEEVDDSEKVNDNTEASQDIPQETPSADNAEPSNTADAEPDVTSNRYLDSNLTFEGNRLLDHDKNGVMMAWETGIMEKSAKALLPTPGLHVLNIGFGMGIVDGIIQSLHPGAHHIVEAHPTVIADMKSKGWHEKPGVVIHEGKWQDVLPKLINQGETFDAIYYDTFAESYSDFSEFFSEQVIGLLEPSGKWGFFNGMGADRQISYDVYQKVVEMDLLEAGFDIEWEDIKVPSLDEEWDGVRRKYWVVDNYRLPVCRYLD